MKELKVQELKAHVKSVVPVESGEGIERPSARTRSN